MAAFCIPKPIAAQFKEAFKSGEITVEKLYKMTSEERRTTFAKYAGRDMAKEVNVGFEKAMASNQAKVFKKWAEATLNGKDKKERMQTVLDKINSLNEDGLLTPDNEDAFLQDLVTEKLGVSVTPKEARVISDKAKQIQKLASDKSDYNTPTLEYFKAKQDMDNYISGLTPSSRLKIATSTIARGNMLFNLHSPLLNIESNTIQGFLHAAERRIVSRHIFGLNGNYARGYVRFAMDVYNKTGYDVSRFEALGGDRKVRGEDYLHSQGKGAVRLVGRTFEDLIFKKTQGLPDVAFSASHFSDSANINSSIRARATGLKSKEMKAKALEIFKDATSLDPQTPEGIQVRAQAIADALAGTYTNDTLYSGISLGIRKVFNIASGDFRAGDVILPFVKTPANVLGAGLDASGVTVPIRVIYGMQKTFTEIRKGSSWDDAVKESFAGMVRSTVRAGVGLTFAYMFSNLFKPEDFIGQWPTSPTEQQLIDLRKATTNSVKIGDKWVSLDYLGPLGAPILGFLYAKKYGKNLGDDTFRYAQGVGQTLQNLPGLKEAGQAYTQIQKMEPSNKNGFDAIVPALEKGVAGFLESRIVPAFVNDIAKATDPFDRDLEQSNPLSQAEKQIPGLRENLPIKKDLFGNKVEGEGWLSVFAFGSRIKIVNDSPVIKELVRLDKEGELPAITDVAKSSTRAKELQNQIGSDKFDQAMTDFGKNLDKGMQATIASAKYKTATSQQQKAMLDNVKEKLFTQTLDEYGYVSKKGTAGGTWDTTKNKTLDQFEKAVGSTTFTKASQQFDKEYTDWRKQTLSSKSYKALSDKQKQSVLKKGRAVIQGRIFTKYNFEYQRQPKADTSSLDRFAPL